jgi:hypothetical protein
VAAAIKVVVRDILLARLATPVELPAGTDVQPVGPETES